MRFADLPTGFVIAHRGGSLQAPENTLEAYRVAAGQRLPVLEQDVQVLADGALGVMHDGTVDRTTTSAGNVADHTAATWKRLRIDAGTYLDGGWGNDLRPPLFDEVLDEFGADELLCPEAKSPGTIGPLLDALDRRGRTPDTVVVQSFSRPDCLQAVARGWPAMWLGSVDAAQAAADGIAWISPHDRVVTAELCEQAHALGTKVACYTVNRRWRRDEVLAAGVDAVFSDDPAYLHDDAGRRRSATFAAQGWLPGMQADNGARGSFSPEDGSYGFPADAGGGPCSWALVGCVGPPDPAAFTLDVPVTFDGTRSTDSTESTESTESTDDGACVVLTTTDRPVTGRPAAHVDGYQVWLLRSGVLAVDRLDGGVAAPAGRSAGGAPVPPGAQTVLRVTVSAGGLDVARLLGPGREERLGVRDGALRPLPFLHLGRRSAGVRFAEVTFS